MGSMEETGTSGNSSHAGLSTISIRYIGAGVYSEIVEGKGNMEKLGDKARNKKKGTDR